MRGVESGWLLLLYGCLEHSPISILVKKVSQDQGPTGGGSSSEEGKRAEEEEKKTNSKSGRKNEDDEADFWRTASTVVSQAVFSLFVPDVCQGSRQPSLTV